MLGMKAVLGIFSEHGGEGKRSGGICGSGSGRWIILRARQAPLTSRVYGLAEGDLKPGRDCSRLATRRNTRGELSRSGFWPDSGTRTVQIWFKRVGRNRP